MWPFSKRPTLHEPDYFTKYVEERRIADYWGEENNKRRNENNRLRFENATLKGRVRTLLGVNIRLRNALYRLGGNPDDPR